MIILLCQEDFLIEPLKYRILTDVRKYLVIFTGKICQGRPRGFKYEDELDLTDTVSISAPVLRSCAGME